MLLHLLCADEAMRSLAVVHLVNCVDSLCDVWSRLHTDAFLVHVKRLLLDKLNVSLRSIMGVGALTSLPVNVGVSVGCVVGARYIAKIYFDRRDNLKNRVTVLCEIKQLVLQWERSYVAEMRSLCWQNAIEHNARSGLRREERDYLIQMWERTATVEGRRGTDTPFFGIMNTFSFSPHLDLPQLLAWCVTGYASLSLPTDLAWVDRLSRIARHVVLRRLAVMEEARHYAALHRRVHFGGEVPESFSRVFPNQTTVPFLRSYSIFGRPSWLVSVASAPGQPFLALPLSYFPVEAILSFHAADEMTGWFPLVEVLTPQWKRVCESTLSRFFADRSAAENTDCIPVKESFLYLQYTRPLFRIQKELMHKMGEAFYHDKMYGGVAGYEGCGLDTAMYASRSTVPGFKRKYRSATRQRRFRQALFLLYGAELFYSFTKVLLPSWRTLLTPLLFASLVGRGTTQAGAGAAVVLDDATRVRPLRDLALYVLSLSLSSLIRTALRTRLSRVEQFVTGTLDEEIVSAIQSNLLRGDEAFVGRYVELEEDEARLGPDRQIRSVRSALQPRGGALLQSFKTRVKCFNNVIACCAIALWRNELRLLCFSVFVEHGSELLLKHLYGRLGFNYPVAVNDLLDRLESARLPDDHPYGLAVVLDVLAEAEGTGSGGKAEGKGGLAFPFLSLLATSAVSKHPAPEDDRSTTTLGRREVLYSRVAAMRIGGLLPPCASLTAHSYLKGLQLDARCVWVYGIQYPYAYYFQFRQSAASARTGGAVYHEYVDPYEREMFEKGNVAKRLPPHLDACTLMTRPFRFITRLLGIDVIAAQHTVFLLGAQRQSKAMGNFFVRSAQSFYGLFVIASNCTKFLSSFLFVLTVCVRIGGNGSGVYSIASLRAEECLRLKSHMDLYAAMLCHGPVANYIVEVQQLVQHIPCWIMDDSECSSVLRACAKEWQAHLSQSSSRLQFDATTNLIIGGVTLDDAIRFRNVFFTYPQLHHSFGYDGTEPDGEHSGQRALRFKPILAAANLTLPCRGATSIIGDTGSGKSSILKVLRRIYDPLAPIEVVPAPDSVAPAWWCSDEALGELLRLQLVTCPAAFPFEPKTCTARADGVTLRVTERTCITLDGVPITCFSPAYIRSWLSYLDQQTPVFSHLSFYANVRYLSPFVTADDVAYAVEVANCAEFIAKRPLGLAGPCGELSGGERQRLAVARTLACARGRVHGEWWCRSCGERAAAPSAVQGALLLDEPTSRLDAFSELQIVRTLERLAAEDGADSPDRAASFVVPLLLLIVSPQTQHSALFEMDDCSP
ncbi:ABC transporter family-like protein [Strigomonas culicis]|uniref:ABC transporter family-like protein n=1 Tax=Strigomonas culicis TaxID=28005 RepID=S9TND0_9TRYP|nr:ABC transporter family-like protein [Strigomonas culicis]|eukprot:EPY19787.1 ABC transporter family-like protein [Strigomonas culicis]